MSVLDHQEYTLNFGPQHPAAHGVLRLMLTMKGEKIVGADPHIGLLHRGTEKLVEQRTYQQSIGYMDRLDYVSMMCNEHAYVLAIESLLGIQPPIRAQYIRVLFDEITRLLNHLMWLGAHGLDVGAMSMFLYCFKEREALMDCYEAVSGSRMHATYYRPGGVHRDLPSRMPLYKKAPGMSQKQLDEQNKYRGGSLLDFIEAFAKDFEGQIDQYENLLTDNHIWRKRLEHVGVLSPDMAIALGCTGPVLRASGLSWDLRKNQPYAVYEHIDFSIPIGKNGDCFDRYKVRVEEMRQSRSIILQCVDWLKKNTGPVIVDNHKIAPPDFDRQKTHMEEMIHHFKFFSEGFSLPVGEIYRSIEHPKGEFGIYLVSDGANKPYRLKIRSAGFPHLAALPYLVRDHFLADVVTIIGSLDIVFGEIDR